MAGIVPKKLVELTTDTNNALITALVLTKTEPRSFLSKQSSDYRGVISYTLRDTKRHIVNCKCWGTREHVTDYHRKLKIFDIVDVISPKILPAFCATSELSGATAAQATHFQPLATLPYTLVLNEGEGRLCKHDYRDMDSCQELRNLTRVPHRPLCSALNLMDVRGNTGNNLQPQGQFVDLLLVVAALRPLRELRSARTGEMLSCLELIVVDRSCVEGMVLTIWNTDWIERAQKYWQPINTILHLVDVKVAYSDFHKAATLAFTARTLVYENPLGTETEMLAAFAATASIKDRDMLALAGANSLPQPEQITQQMTIRQIYARAEGHLKDDSEQFTAVLYAMVTKFDLDGTSLITSKRCKSCHRLLSKNQFLCDTDQCQLAISIDSSSEPYEAFFNINIHFSDHTGTLSESRLSGPVAEQQLGLTLADFSKLSTQQKEKLKWRFLLNYVEAKLLVKKQNAVRRNLTIIVVDVHTVQLDTLARKISVF